MIQQADTHIGQYYYIFPTYSQGKKAIWEGRDKEGVSFLDHIPDDRIEAKNNSELKIVFKNQSLIRIVGSDNIDALMGTSPRGCVFSEYSLQHPQAWDFIRPILVENGGWARFNYCVARGTLVITEQGLRRIESISPSRTQFTPLNQKIYGIQGLKNATDFYYGGKKCLLKLRTKKGYEISCTPNHPLWNGKEWVRAEDWREGDYVPIQLGQNVFSSVDLDISSWERPKPKSNQGNWKSLGDNFLTKEFFYLMGLYLAEGNSSLPGIGKGASLTITNSDAPIISFLNSMGFVTRKDGIHHDYCGTEIQSFFMWFGLNGTAKEKSLPDRLFNCNKIEIRAFLKGYFDGDGTASRKFSGQVKATSASRGLLQSLQVLLLNFGIVSRLSEYQVPPTKKVSIWCTVYNIEIEGYFAYLFFERIGFRLSRKQDRKELLNPKIKECRGDMIPTDPDLLGFYPKSILRNPSLVGYRKLKELNQIRSNPYIETLISEGYFWDKIDSIEECEEEVFDFVIPETNSFFSNGFISHNTPRGKNHGYDLYIMAKDNPEWHVSLLTIDDTGFITPEDIEKERLSGMSEDLIQQEFYCSFSRGQEGSWYGKSLAVLECDGRFTNVSHDPYAPVDTFWDLGVGDSTAIIFAQKIGQEIHLIDHYEMHGEGLDHYARIIKERDYNYGTHYAPHDIRVRELASGARTRLEIARDLGLNFSIVPDLSVYEGIELTRSLMHKVWIDEKKCKYLFKCLLNYVKRYNETYAVYSDQPLHNWASHSADAARLMGIIYSQRNTFSKSLSDIEREDKLYRRKVM